MEIDHLITPYKYGRAILAGSGADGEFDAKAVDCPTPFFHNDRFYMMYVGFDGQGYQTGLACSNDLVSWEKLGVILPRDSNLDWDRVGMAGTGLLMENDLYSERRLRKYQGKYWLVYHSYPAQGYEAGSAEIGLAYTEDEDLLKWSFVGEPVFSWRDGEPWERGGLYKGWLLEYDKMFYLFYNAKENDNGGWTEQTGVAVSKDLMQWCRMPSNPVLSVTAGAWDSRFASDPAVFYDSLQKRWVMFYYGLGNLSACDGIAVSEDLLSWRKFPAPILTIGGKTAIDSKYAHKPGIIFHDGVLYHFYCACRPWQEYDPARNLWDEFRCISAARSVPW